MYHDNNKYIRDERSGALVNADNEAYEMYKAERQKIINMMEMEKQVANLSGELSDIKQLLLKLVNGNNNV